MQSKKTTFSEAFTARMQRAATALDQKTKPPGSLGVLETIAMQVSAIQDSLTPDLSTARAILFAADHGVVDEGISAYPQAVTQQMLLNFVAGGAAANALCLANNVELEVVNVGVIGDTTEGVIDAKVAEGTANSAKLAAMSDSQLTQAIDTGRHTIQRAADAGIKLVALGEMGIGNTTSAAAIVSALCDVAATQSAGPGTGLDHSGVARKVSVVNQMLSLHPSRDAMDVLRSMGGFEIAAMCGAMLEAGEHKITLLVDGYIVTAAALCAVAINPATREQLVFAHRSAEPGHIKALEHLNATPLFDFNLRLGEGSGAILAVPVVRSAASILNNMATFETAGVDREL